MLGIIRLRGAAARSLSQTRSSQLFTKIVHRKSASLQVPKEFRLSAHRRRLYTRPAQSPEVFNKPAIDDPEFPKIIETTAEIIDKNYPSPIYEDRTLVTYADKTIGEVLNAKQRHIEPEFISQDITVYDAINRMTELRIGALLVHDDNMALCGIFTERDYLNKIAVKGRNSRFTQVKEVMTTTVITVPTNVKIGPALQMLTEKRFRHLPVMNDTGDIVGLVSIGDLVKEITQQYRETIHNMKEFIERMY
jgi:CBS domain-containing protein